MAKQQLTCDNCDHTFEVDVEEVGDRVRCPECYTVIEDPASPSGIDESAPDDPAISGSTDTPDGTGDSPPAEPQSTVEGGAGEPGRDSQPDPSTGRSASSEGSGTSQFSVENVIVTSFRMFFEDFGTVVGLGVVVLSPLLLLALWLLVSSAPASSLSTAWQYSSMFGGLVLTPLLSGAMIYGVIQKLNDRDFVISECISSALSKLFPLIGLSLLQALAIGLGTALCILPGVFVAMILYVCVPVLVIEETGVFEAMERSYDLTKGNLLRIFGIMVVIFLLNVILGSAVTFGTVGLQIQTATVQSVKTYIFLSSVLSVLTNTITSITIATTYYFLRLGEEDTTVEELVNLFD